MKKVLFFNLFLAFISSVAFAKSDASTRSAVLNTATNQAQTMCSSKAYTNCYNITKNECIKMLKPMIKECFKRYKSSIFSSSTSSHLTLVGNKIGKCAGNKYHDKLEHQSIQKCLDKEDRKFR